MNQRDAEGTAQLESANRALEDERALLAQRVAERTAALGAANAELARAARLKDEFLLDSRLARLHDGTGLGLSLVRRMTELHAGSASLESEPGRGSRFTVSLP